MADNIPTIKLNPLTLTINKIIDIVSPMFQLDEKEVALIKVGPIKLYCFRNPQAINEIYINKSCALFKDPKSLTWATWFMRNGLFNDTGSHWREKRLRAQAHFMPKCVPGLVQTCLANEQQLVDYVLGHGENSNSIIDGLELCAFFTTDFALNVLFGVRQRDDVAELRNLTFAAESGFTSLLPLWIPTKKALYFKKTEKALTAYFFAEGRRLQNNPNENDTSVAATVLQTLSLDLNKRKDQEQFLSELYGIYFGFTAISVAGAWILYHLCLHREHTQKIIAELSIQQASEHLDKFILESLRLKPPFWGSARFAQEPTTISGIAMPKGSNLIAMRYFSNRHKDYWDSPEQFFPERFSKENVASRERFVYQNFGLGPRSCVGRHLAIPLLTKMVKVLLQHFEIGLVKPGPQTPLLNFDFGLLPQDLMLKLKRKRTI